MAKKRMHRGLVALSTAAIAAVYTAGYLHTQGADASIAIAESIGAAQASATPFVLAPTPTPLVLQRAPDDRRDRGRGGQFAPAPPQPTPTLPAPPAAPLLAYRDGTYTGSGTSRRGGVEVAITVQGARITNVKITRSTLQYPVSDIAALPGQVVARQSAQVDLVSGATFSTSAFRAAVQQALAQAK